jgi:hypothetical protein
MSVLYIGAYAISYCYSYQNDSRSVSNGTAVSKVSVSVSNTSCSNCVAAACSLRDFDGVNSYGGSMSVLYIGAYAFSYSFQTNSRSASEATTVSGVSVSVSNASCSNCTAATSSKRDSDGANSYGGSMSVLYIGAYAWSFSDKADSSSASAATNVSGVSVSVSNAGCSNCTAATSSQGVSLGTNSYGGSMSVLYIGAYAWSFSFEANSLSASEATTMSGVIVSVSNSSCSKCTSDTSGAIQALGALSFGGAISLYVGAHCFSYSNGARSRLSRSFCDLTRVFGLNISLETLDVHFSRASSRAFSLGCFVTLKSLLCFRSSWQRPGCKCMFPAPFVCFASDAAVCSARSVVDACAQVYGGAVSVKIGAYARSQIGTGDSNATCEETICEGCLVSLSRVTVADSGAVSEAAGDELSLLELHFPQAAAALDLLFA